MKKTLITLALIALTAVGYSQSKPVDTITKDTAAVLSTFDVNALEQHLNNLSIQLLRPDTKPEDVAKQIQQAVIFLDSKRKKGGNG